MNDEALNPRDLDGRQSEIELLARETDTPIDIVHKIYTIERAKLDQVARIKTYVPVLIHRHVKELLQAQRTALRNSMH